MLTYFVLDSYLIADNVIFLVITDKSYPRKLAFSYLDELSKEFQLSYGAKVDTVRKPYAFVGFGMYSPNPAVSGRSRLTLVCAHRHIHVKDHSVIPRHADCQCGRRVAS